MSLLCGFSLFGVGGGGCKKPLLRLSSEESSSVCVCARVLWDGWSVPHTAVVFVMSMRFSETELQKPSVNPPLHWGSIFKKINTVK